MIKFTQIGDCPIFVFLSTSAEKKKNAMVDASRKIVSFERGMTHVFMLRIDGLFIDYP